MFVVVYALLFAELVPMKAVTHKPRKDNKMKNVADDL
jgi:hypothetical protein